MVHDSMSPRFDGPDPSARSREAPGAPCPICSEPSGEPTLTLRDTIFGAAGTWRLLRCEACAHAWLDPQPASDDLASLYESYYTHDPDEAPRRVASALALAMRRTVLAGEFGYGTSGPVGNLVGAILARSRLLRDIVGGDVMWCRSPETENRLLDIGCGDGMFLERMRDLGWHVAGVEADPAAVRIARGRDLEITEGSIDALETAPEAADVVTLHHVIEHTPDPVRSLRRVAALLRPGGQIVIATPNTGSLLCSRFGRYWRGWEPPRHLHVFNPKNLAAVAERAGLQVRSIRTSARSAEYFFFASEMIRENEESGSTGLREPSPERLLRALAWRSIEATACWFGWEGEEIVLVAEAPPAS